MSVRRTVLLVGALALAAPWSGAAWAQDDSETLAEAARLYDTGQFGEAAAAWRSAVERGLDGPRVQYNLGNALYRSGRLGEAVAHYLAARAMAPREEDIDANLTVALREREGGPPVPPPTWLHALGAAIVRSATLSELALGAAVLYWVAMGAWIASLLQIGRRRRALRAAIVAGALALLVTGVAVARWWSYHRTEEAVVVAETTQMRTGPGESFEITQPMSEAWTVRVLGREAGWLRVVGEGGSRGWLPGDAVMVVPVPWAGDGG